MGVNIEDYLEDYIYPLGYDCNKFMSFLNKELGILIRYMSCVVFDYSIVDDKKRKKFLKLYKVYKKDMDLNDPDLLITIFYDALDYVFKHQGEKEDKQYIIYANYLKRLIR